MDAPSSEKLSRILVESFAPVLPDGISLRAEWGNVGIYFEGVWQASSGGPSLVEERDGRNFAELLEAAARSALSGVQDCISEVLRDRWPKIDGAPVDSVPDVRVADGVLQLRYVALNGSGSILLSRVESSELSAPVVD